MTRGRLITTFGPMATMLRGFIFEGLTYAPIRDLIAVVGGLRSNRKQFEHFGCGARVGGAKTIFKCFTRKTLKKKFYRSSLANFHLSA